MTCLGFSRTKKPRHSVSGQGHLGSSQKWASCSASPPTRLADSASSWRCALMGTLGPSSEGRQCRVARVRAVADDLPSKPGADLSQGVWLSVPKHDEVLRVEGDHKISIVTLKCHQPSRMHHARGQRTLLRNANRDIQKNSLSVCRVTPRLLKCRLHNPEGVTPWETKGHVQILTWSVRANRLLHRR